MSANQFISDDDPEARHGISAQMGKDLREVLRDLGLNGQELEPAAKNIKMQFDDENNRFFKKSIIPVLGSMAKHDFLGLLEKAGMQDSRSTMIVYTLGSVTDSRCLEQLVKSDIISLLKQVRLPERKKLSADQMFAVMLDIAGEDSTPAKIRKLAKNGVIGDLGDKRLDFEKFSEAIKDAIKNIDKFGHKMVKKDFLKELMARSDKKQASHKKVKAAERYSSGGRDPFRSR